MIHEKFPKSFPRFDSTSRIKSHAIRRADHVICISENTRRDLLEITGLSPGKTSVVKLGWSLLSAPTPDLAVGVPDEAFLLYVGGRGGYKNFSRLLKVYARSKRLRDDFLLVSFGGGAFSEGEVSEVTALGLAPNRVIQVSGDDNVLAGLYSSATLLSYPSLYEGFGIPPLEAMSFGCPVVCSNSSSLPEVVGDAAELFDPSDDKEMLEAVERVAYSHARTEQLVARGKDRIKLFSWEKCAEETLDVYRRVVRG